VRRGVSQDRREASSLAPDQPPAATAVSTSGWTWATVLFGVYAAGVLISALRLWSGWRGQRRIVAQSSRITLPERFGCETVVTESALLATPATIGITSPLIVLPAEWRRWSDETLRAVVAHEKAHVARQDPLTAFVSQVNACVFWFHPVAWWLERALSASAEQACDQAGVGELGRADHYARILVDMADVVRANRGRLRAPSVGALGSSLESRIDRILGPRSAPVPRWRRVAVSGLCVAAMIAVASCRQPSRSAGDLRPDPARAAAIATEKASRQWLEAAARMTDPDAARLEAGLKANPEDLATREILLDYYLWNRPSSPAAINSHRASYSSNVLWLIAHHPDSDLVGRHVIPASIDPAGSLEATRLWLPLVEKPDAPAAVLGNAGIHFCVSDPVLGEQLLQRARTLEPDQPAGSSLQGTLSAPRRWSLHLAQLYVEAIAGGGAVAFSGAVLPAAGFAGQTRVRPAASRPLDPIDVRRKLESSSDQTLLLYVASSLTGRYPRDPERVTFGRRLAERVLQINPQSASARQLLMPDRTPFYRTLTAFQRDTPNQAQYDAVTKMSDADRFAYLPELAERDYMVAEARDFAQRNAPEALARWQRSKRYARDLLELLPRFRNDPDYGTAFYRANIALGLHALREGDGRTAVKYLTEASTAPRTEKLAYSQEPIHLEGKLVYYLLKYGEREPVAAYLERTALIMDGSRASRLKAAASIRQGVMPESFQWTYSTGRM
jgi:beta-lactamase regulating signal transducer with metallopeptidase domain